MNEKSDYAAGESELGDVLSSIENTVTRKEIALAARVSLSMVDSWISGSKTVSHRRLKLMLQRGPAELVEALSRYFYGGTGYVVRRRARAEAGDPLSKALEAVGQAAGFAEATRKATADGRVDEAEVQRLELLGAVVVRDVGAALDNLRAAAGRGGRGMKLAGA